jgi:hypothetical protein
MNDAQAWNASRDVCLAGRNRSLGSEPEPQHSSRTRAEQLDFAARWFGRGPAPTNTPIDLLELFFFGSVR